MTQGSDKYYLHYDQVGSLRAVTDTNHNIIKVITYDTYGNIVKDTNPSFKVVSGFAGGLYDSDTNLVRFGYRDYDPYTGKWTAKDPIDFEGGDSNLYGYVLGDPVNFVDPTGEYWTWVARGAWIAGKWVTKKVRVWVTKRPKDIPSTWRVRKTKKGGGKEYYDPNNKNYNNTRLMPGGKNKENSNPYRKDKRNGQTKDINGNTVPGNSSAAHQPYCD